MKLLGYIINNKILGKDIFTCTQEQLGNNEPWKLSNNIIAGYGDITSIANYHKFGYQLCDVKKLISGMIEYMTTVGFDNLTPEEKIIACQYFLVDSSIIIQYLTPEEIANYWSDLNLKTKAARQARWDATFNYLSLNLSKANGFDLAFTIDTIGLGKNYLTYGLESFAIDGVPGLWDYMENTSIYGIDGFASKPYYTLALQNGIMSILRDGNY